jgi:hypothetical protein
VFVWAGEGVGVFVRAAVGEGVGVAVSGFELEPIRILAATGM